MLGRQGHGVLRHGCLAGAGVRCDKHTVALQAAQQECQLLDIAAFVVDHSEERKVLHRQGRLKSVPIPAHHAMYAMHAI